MPTPERPKNSFRVTMRIDTPLDQYELKKWLEDVVPMSWNLFDYDINEEEF